MLDFDRFVAWYLSPFTRISRGGFNIIILVLTLPVFAIKMQSGVETLTDKVQQFSPVIEHARNMGASFGGGMLPPNLESIMQKNEETRVIAQEFIETFQETGDNFGLDTEYNIDTPSDRSVIKDASKYLNILIYMFLVPVMFMRMRDMGLRSQAAMWATIAATYSVFVSDALAMFNIYEIGFVPQAGLSVLSFFVFMWLCTHKSFKSEEAPRKNYMPGDNPDDPY